MLLYYYNLMNSKKYLKGTNFALVTQLHQKFLFFLESYNFLHIEYETEETDLSCKFLWYFTMTISNSDTI